MWQSRFSRQQSRRLRRRVHSPGEMRESQQSALSGVPEMGHDLAGGSRFGFFDSQHEHRGQQSQDDADGKQHMKVRDSDRQK